MRGKVLVINAEILASLTFLAATLPAPANFIRSIKKILFGFLWGSKHEKIRREIMYKTVEKGGLAVPEISSKLDWMLLTPILKACLNENQEILWHCFANVTLTKIGFVEIIIFCFLSFYYTLNTIERIHRSAL